MDEGRGGAATILAASKDRYGHSHLCKQISVSKQETSGLALEAFLFSFVVRVVLTNHVEWALVACR